MRVPTYALLLCKEVPSSAPYIYFLRVDESIFSCLPVALRGGREMSTVPEKQASKQQRKQQIVFYTELLLLPPWPRRHAGAVAMIQGSRHSRSRMDNGIQGWPWRKNRYEKKKAPLNRAFLQDYWGQIGIENRGSAFFTKK